jgi:hypothetical protein
LAARLPQRRHSCPKASEILLVGQGLAIAPDVTQLPIARAAQRRLYSSPRSFAMLNSVTPFFIVDDLGATLAFYQSKLAFDVLYKGGGDENGDD